jgi:hypothetical protein
MVVLLRSVVVMVLATQRSSPSGTGVDAVHYQSSKWNFEFFGKNS